MQHSAYRPCPAHILTPTRSSQHTLLSGSGYRRDSPHGLIWAGPLCAPAPARRGSASSGRWTRLEGLRVGPGGHGWEQALSSDGEEVWSGTGSGEVLRQPLNPSRGPGSQMPGLAEPFGGIAARAKTASSSPRSQRAEVEAQCLFQSRSRLTSVTQKVRPPQLPRPP